MANEDRKRFAAGIKAASLETAQNIRDVAVAEGQRRDMASGIQIGLSAADEFMKALSVVTGNILKKASITLQGEGWFDDIGIHCKAKKVAKCIAFILKHGHPTYQKLMKDSLAYQYSRAVFTHGNDVKEGSRMYPVSIIQEEIQFIFLDRDAFKAWCLYKLYVPEYADPRDIYKFHITSKGFSNLLLGQAVSHNGDELPIDAMSLEDIGRRQHMDIDSGSTTQNVASGGTGQGTVASVASTNSSFSATSPGT